MKWSVVSLVLVVALSVGGCKKKGPSAPSGPIWTHSGQGNSVFDMPTSVDRVRITGHFSGFCENFIVWVAGQLLVNEILGTCSVGTAGLDYQGTHLTSGGVAEVKDSNGVAWTFTEVR